MDFPPVNVYKDKSDPPEDRDLFQWMSSPNIPALDGRTMNSLYPSMAEVTHFSGDGAAKAFAAEVAVNGALSSQDRAAARETMRGNPVTILTTVTEMARRRVCYPPSDNLGDQHNAFYNYLEGLGCCPLLDKPVWDWCNTWETIDENASLIDHVLAEHDYDPGLSADVRDRLQKAYGHGGSAKSQIFAQRVVAAETPWIELFFLRSDHDDPQEYYRSVAVLSYAKMSLNMFLISADNVLDPLLDARLGMIHDWLNDTSPQSPA